MTKLPRPRDPADPSAPGPTIKFRTKTTELTPRELPPEHQRAFELYEQERKNTPLIRRR